MDPFVGPAGLKRRLSFAATPEPIVCEAYLTGLLVAIDTDANRRAELAGVLESVGIEADAHPQHGMVFAVSQLYRVAMLPESVGVDVDPELEVLWHLALRYGSGQLDGPATLQSASGRPLLRWEASDGDDDLEGVLTPAAAAALLHSQLPFIATADAWETVTSATRLPLQAAVLQHHRDGYVQIQAVRPQLVESSPIPGLWRIDQTTYGAALPYAHTLTGIGGLRWDGPAPGEVSQVAVPVAVSGRLDGHVADGARRLAQLVRDHGSAVIAWPSGLGRRVAALAALEAVDTLPVQILSPAWAVWSWTASLATLGLNDDRARIVTWDAVGTGAALHATPALIVDDFTGDDALAVAGALRHLENLDGVARIGVCSQWPTDPNVMLAAMHLVRPGEFPRAAAGALLRYPLWPLRRANEHADAYRIPLPPLAVGRPYRRRFDVHTVTLPEPLRRQIGELCELHRADGTTDGTTEDAVEQIRELTTAGGATGLSPTVSQVVGQVRRLSGTGQQVLVVARHERTLDRLRPLLRGAAAARLVTWADSDTLSWSDHGADTVLVCDYPDRPEQLWNLVGQPEADEGAAVLLWHTRRSVDDELAVTSSRGVPAAPERLLQVAAAGANAGMETPEAFGPLL